MTYPVPKPKGGGGSSKKPTKAVAVKLQGTSGKNLASSGLKVAVKFSKAGTISCTVKHNGTTIGSGSATAKKRTTKTLTITFTPAGKTFLKTGAGQKVTVSCTFKPKSGKSVTSTATVTLG